MTAKKTSRNRTVADQSRRAAQSAPPAPATERSAKPPTEAGLECIELLAAHYRNSAIRYYESHPEPDSTTARDTFEAACRTVADYCQPRPGTLDDLPATITTGDIMSNLWLRHIQEPTNATLAMAISVGCYKIAMHARTSGDTASALDYLSRAIEMLGTSNGIEGVLLPAESQDAQLKRSRLGGTRKGKKKAPAVKKLKELLNAERPSAGWTTARSAHDALLPAMTEFVKGRGITSNVSAALDRWLKLPQVARVAKWRVKKAKRSMPNRSKRNVDASRGTKKVSSTANGS